LLLTPLSAEPKKKLVIVSKLGKAILYSSFTL